MTTSATVTQSQVSVVATAGTHMVFIKGSGDIISLSGGNDRISDTGRGNTYILPSAGKGMDIFNSNVLNTSATLDLKNALAATTWTGSASTVSNYLTVNNTASGATIAISATSGGPGTAIASMAGATGLNLTTVLAHAIV